MSWVNCDASLSLVAEVNARWPRRDKASDGTIGDAAHASRKSDHNPWVRHKGQGIVRARDIDVDGVDMGWLMEHLRKMGQAGDKRLANGGYLIFNECITKRDFSGWKVYTGKNKHISHGHVSFTRTVADFHIVAHWGIAGPTPAAPRNDGLVRTTQRAVNSNPVDGIWGPDTDGRVMLVRAAALNRSFGNVRELQRVIGSVADGDWGTRSKAALVATVKLLQSSWGTMSDGLWGNGTDKAWSTIRAIHRKGI